MKLNKIDARCVLLAVAVLFAGCNASVGLEESATASEKTLTVVSETQISERLVELVVASPAMERDLPLRVLLPTGYDPDAAAPYPVLYLLHGCCNSNRGHATYVDNIGIEAFTGDLRVIFVMPEGGASGLYSDWYNNGLGGPPRWETHHIRELVPFIEQRFHTRRDRNGRGLLGISMGGHGAFAYAAKYPDLFGSASAISPALDSNTTAGGPVLDGGAAFDSSPPGSVWGPRATEEVRWRGHNPVDLAENLGNAELFIRTGNGHEPGSPVFTDLFEWGVHEMAVNMHNELKRFDIPHEFTDYGPGGHSQEEFQRSVRILMPKQVALLQKPARTVTRFSYRSIDPAFSAFDWQVNVEREVIEFTRLGEVSEAGFRLSGSGRATVITAPWYRPGAGYVFTVDGTSQTAQADSEGRLRLELDLGPSRTIQQYRPGSPDGFLRTITVTITAS